ncbi:MAG: hypothetical protein KJ601_01470 [Nanoarchaeota archaeon]|nr:hypothetical protein [Nanoarchaeota archaeon]MBU1705002.1 hypothetical protein [Nanoarchaeota archaeon]
MKITIDTNFLMSILTYKVDLYSELDRVCDFKYELAVIDKTIDELKKIQEVGKGKDKRTAKLALDIIRAKGIKQILSKEENVDDAIVAEKNSAVATNDRDLIARLKGRKIIRLRAKRYLMIQ